MYSSLAHVHVEWSYLIRSSMSFHMTFQIEVGEERLIADFACESFYTGVHFNMFV